MLDMVEDVLAFQRRFGCHIGAYPQMPPQSVDTLRMKLVYEEYNELKAAWKKNDLPSLADAIVDLIYVLLGKAIAWGIDIRPIWREVHAANMRKEGGGLRSDGKILKPPGWQAPRVEELIGLQIHLAQQNGGSLWTITT